MDAPLVGRQLTKAIERAVLDKYLYDMRGWAVLREVTIDDNEVPTRGRRRRSTTGVPSTRRIDLLLMRTGRRSKPPHERIALEIKVSRADFKRDTDEKRRAWFSVADRFAYVAPLGLIKRSEVPPGCGLMEYDPTALFGHQQLKWTVIAPRRTTPPTPFDTQFFAYLMGRASRAEERLRQLE